MGLIRFTRRILLTLVIVIVIMSFIWPYIEPLLPGIRLTITGMFTALESAI